MSPGLIQYNDLYQHPLPQGGCIYCVFGEEPLLRIESIDYIRKWALEQNFGPRIHYSADESKFNYSVVLQDLGTRSLFGSKKFVELDLSSVTFGVTLEKSLLPILKTANKDTILLISMGKIDWKGKKLKFFDYLINSTFMVECPQIKTEMLAPWLRARLQREELPIHNDALVLFCERVEGNLLAAKQEVEKLGLILPKGTEVSVEDIDKCISNLASFDIMEFAQVWMNGDLMRTRRFVQGMREDEATTPLFKINAFLLNDLNLILQFRERLEMGQRTNEILRDLRIFGEKQKYVPIAANRIGMNCLIDAVLNIGKMDLMSKGGLPGDPWALFMNTMASLVRGR